MHQNKIQKNYKMLVHGKNMYIMVYIPKHIFKLQYVVNALLVQDIRTKKIFFFNVSFFQKYSGLTIHV